MNMYNIYIYVIFAKMIEAFWSKDVTDIRLAHFEFKIYKDF